MYELKYKITYFILFIFAATGSATIVEVKSIFGSSSCIKGSLSTITADFKEIFSVKESANLNLKNISVANTQYESDKSAMANVHELAQFNEIDYFYKLIKEEGPPHNKLFTVSLTLGDEEFIGEGSSLKKAQQKVAATALEGSEYQRPLIKTKDVDAATPTVLLNNLCAKLGFAAEYFVVSDRDVLNGGNKDKSKKSYFQKLNESMDSDMRIPSEESQTKGPFNIAVRVGDLYFYGTSHTIQAARHEAAKKAIDHLVKVVKDGDSVCLQEGAEEECKQAKAELKSPISLVYEAAQLRSLPVEFEIVDSFGPSHKKTFITECKLGHLYTKGEGKSKKESKKVAAVNMLEKLSELPGVSQEMQVQHIIKNKTKRKKNNKNKILKSNFEVINMHIENMISSVKDYASPFENAKESKTGKPSKYNKPGHYQKSYQDGILELSNTLQFEVQFTDFDDKEQFYSLASLYMTPEYICLGQGLSSKDARNVAAKNGLHLLQNIDLESHIKNRKLTLLEKEIKLKINILLNGEVFQERKDSPTF